MNTICAETRSISTHETVPYSAMQGRSFDEHLFRAIWSMWFNVNLLVGFLQVLQWVVDHEHHKFLQTEHEHHKLLPTEKTNTNEVIQTYMHINITDPHKRRIHAQEVFWRSQFLLVTTDLVIIAAVEVFWRSQFLLVTTRKRFDRIAAELARSLEHSAFRTACQFAHALDFNVRQ